MTEFYSLYNRTNAGAEALKHGITQDGVPYEWGGEWPGVGFDCSGLTKWCYASVGLTIPRTTIYQFKVCPLDRGTPLLPGDLLFIPGSDGTAQEPGHVMMYHSPGKILQAPFTGENVGVYDYDTNVYTDATRPGDLYGAAITAPTAAQITDNGLVHLDTPNDAVVALRNGWVVRGFNVTFIPLPLQGTRVGVAKYAPTNWRNKKK